MSLSKLELYYELCKIPQVASDRNDKVGGLCNQCDESGDGSGAFDDIVLLSTTGGLATEGLEPATMITIGGIDVYF